MELTNEFIESLSVNEVDIMKRIAEELSITVNQVSAVISLVAEGCTIPFISRYRKEKHGSLDEVQVRDCDKLFKSYTNLETRRLEIVRGIFAAGKLTESLYENIMKAVTLAELEDIWLPFKKKKKTRGMLAAERGLQPLADLMKELDDEALKKKAEEFIKTGCDPEELNVPTAADALAGASDIIAEEIAQDSQNRADVRDFFMKTGRFEVKGVGDEEAAKVSVYQMYWDYAEPLNEIKPHRVLAINRGEREGVLEVKIVVDIDEAIELLQAHFTFHNKYHKEAIADGLVRLLAPAVLREIRSDLAENADDHGINIFSENLKHLLMTQPIKGTRTLGVDPGIRTGTKCAALDATGKYLGSFVIYQHKAEEAKSALQKAIKEYDVQLIAVGNGTGSHEVQEIVADVIKTHYPDVLFTVVDEDGASVYSAGDVAREEFPDLDLTIRGAISIGRRLQDPLAELVKIDPKSIGVGLYQHDLNQKKLSEQLDEVVSSVVNNVGVNLNTASASLLKYVSGITSSLAKKIVSYRESDGVFTDREQLKKVSGMGPKTFEQCAGFLKIPESTNPLDNSWVHPENYAAGKIIYEMLHKNAEVSSELRGKIKTDYNIGEQTINDIIEELKKPNRDPREDCPKPIMQQGVLTFEDLKTGMTVKGKIKNVVDFGAFVDLGIKETALLHISEMSDSFISDPLEAVKVGDIVECKIIALDEDRRRISLSRKSGAGQAKLTAKQKAEVKKITVKTKDGKTIVVKSTSGKPSIQGEKQLDLRGERKPAHRGERSLSERRSGKDDDGTKYNPFAQLLKNK
ncbi:helix-hairpin-helix domain-containing protein [Treponema phagedenis]|uniref:helix-hairpin-helix domain-containing protein n=1 Tax=Treponema phagedenis TaxID=162 RepID=UPI0011EF0311|nr:Tex family protein [Treponema phagedenis]TYT78725.1 RNA-binding transcriptional accessory protein [Treponema phagedenis]